MPFSNVSQFPEPRVPTGAAPAYRALPVAAPAEVPNLRDFRAPADEFARRARVPPAAADLGARLRAMAPADMTGVAERLAPKAASAGFGLGAFARGAAALAGPVVGGAQMLMHSGSLNSGEDAELARLRTQSPTIDPPESEMAYANGGFISGPEELEAIREEARRLRAMPQMQPDMSQLNRSGQPGMQGYSPDMGHRTSAQPLPPDGARVSSGAGRYAYAPAAEAAADTMGSRALNAAKSVGRAAKGLGMGLGAGALYEGGAAASEASARMVANNPEQFNTSIGDDGLAANIILASREGQAQREAQANANRPTAQQIERTVSGPTPQPGAQGIERLAGFGQEPAAQRPTPFAAASAARPSAGRAAAAAPAGMLPPQGADEAGFERLISDAQAGRRITTPRRRIGGMDLDAQSEAINAEGRADLGPGGYIMANGTPYIDLAKGNADPEWRQRFDDRQARQNAISDQRPDREQMPVVVKDGYAAIGNAAVPVDVYWRGEAQGGRGREAVMDFLGRQDQVLRTQFDEATNPGERESRQKKEQLGVTADAHVRSAQEQAGASVLGAYANAQATAAGNRQKMTTQQMEKTVEMRKEYEGLPEVKSYKQMVPVYRTMQDAAKRDTPMADINLVYGLAKLFDPTSVVREGEYATVAKSPAIPEWLKGQANHLLGGGKLTTETRRQMLAEAKSRMTMAEGELGRVRTQYDRIATDTGLDPSLITLQSFQTDGGPTGEQGKTKVIGNTTYVFDGKGWVRRGEN